ncbi:MAG: LacI family DNA-binding transcriptional regulator [Lachnospiraceae bacterium]|jgi:LacI family transcriptional regulator
MGKRNRVTTRDIAARTGFSQSTISMILSDRKNVSFSEETINSVKQTAKEMGYKKPAKKTPSKNQAFKKSIIVLCPHFANSYYSTVIHSITEKAREYGYMIFSLSTDRHASNEEEYLKYLSEFEVAGIISLYPPAKIELANRISKQIPIVSIGDKPDTCKFDAVELESTRPGTMIGEHLLSLGHRHITYISTPINTSEVGRIHRLDGLRIAFEKQGLDPSNVEMMSVSTSRYKSYGIDSAEYMTGYELAAKAIDSGTASTAFVGNNDLTAFGIMAALHDRGCRIPGDYSVCGFDNVPLASMPQISLTTIEHGASLKGREAVEIIHRKNRQRSSGERRYIMRLEYEPELIERNTTGKARELL